MPIKILFINAINVTQEIERRFPPLGIGYLVSAMRREFGAETIDAKVIDRNIENEIVSFAPDIVGISVVSQNYNRAMQYAQIAKRHHLPVICGGVHISMAPSTMTKNMDVGILGEGEETFCELIRLYIEKRTFNPDDLQSVRGIIFWSNRRTIVTTENRPLIQSLDTIPFPARDLFAINPVTYMFTSRGCPYRCVFCASSRFWDQVRFYSAEYVANEIEYLVLQHRVTHINFQDDLFMLNPDRIVRITEILLQKGLLGKVDFSGAIRANLVNEKIVSLLKEMGVRMLNIGLESGCDETLKYLKAGSVTVKDNENAVRIIKKFSMLVGGSFIIGAPHESKDDILKTLEFVQKSNLDGVNFYVLTPFPGTPVWDYACSRGLVGEDMDWDKLNVNFEDNSDDAVIVSERLSRKEIRCLFLRFKRYVQRIYVLGLISKGLRNPWKIPGFLIRRIDG
jgi:anaerobic magnesium-protoporphyrin IX monomethyl ester cyclase